MTIRSSDNVRRIGLRVLFVATLMIFAGEFIMYQFGREPYPALILPGFPGQPLIEDTLRYPDPLVVAHFTDGHTEAVEWQNVLPYTPLDVSGPFTLAYRKAQSDPAIANWLASRVEGLFPSNSLAGVEIVWRRARFNIDSESTIHVHDSRLYVDLDGSP